MSMFFICCAKRTPLVDPIASSIKISDPPVSLDEISLEPKQILTSQRPKIDAECLEKVNEVFVSILEDKDSSDIVEFLLVHDPVLKSKCCSAGNSCQKKKVDEKSLEHGRELISWLVKLVRLYNEESEWSTEMNKLMEIHSGQQVKARDYEIFFEKTLSFLQKRKNLDENILIEWNKFTHLFCEYATARQYFPL